MTYLEKKDAWLFSPLVSDKDKEEIRKASDDTWKEMFSSSLRFGTAGLRALLGPGSARLNLLTVRKATIGVSMFLLQRYGTEAQKRGVSISFDNRHFSKEFRDEASRVLNDFGIPVYTFHDPHPTPELSFTVRQTHSIGGIMITASHNPKEYNGYKFYDEKGCQGVYDTIDGLIRVIDGLPGELDVTYKPVDEANRGKVTYLDDDNRFDSAFIAKEVGTSLYKDIFRRERLTKIVFSPECGCNCVLGPIALREAGYDVSPVKEQDYFDPDFSGTENPNPETSGAYSGAFKLIQELNSKGGRYNLILVTDPDADRCGVAFLNRQGALCRLTGNETGALLIDFVLKTLKSRNELPANGVICSTFVTGGQGEKAASLYGIKTRVTATGFKYIGDMVDRMEDDGEKYLFGYEESYGYLLKPFVRDKDSLQSIIAIADMTEYYLRQGKTLDIAYQELSRKTGNYFDTQYNVYFEGPSAADVMKQKIEFLRGHQKYTIGEMKVRKITDYLNRIVIDGTTKHTTALEARDIDRSNCIRYDFEKGGFVAIRPSGTEPKVKFYVEIVGKDENEAKKLADALALDLEKEMGLN